MFYDANATFAPSFIYPGNCLGAYFDKNLGNGTWRQGSTSGYNVWNWIVAPFTNEEFVPTAYDTHGSSCAIYDQNWQLVIGPNVTSIFSATWPSQCPSPSHILTTFATVNIAVALSSLILGNQKVLHLLSCKLLGKDQPHPNAGQWIMQTVLLFLPLGLQLGANAIITVLTRATPGYKDGFTFGQLFLFLAARPRTAWIFALWGAGIGSKNTMKTPGLEPGSDLRPASAHPPKRKENARTKESHRNRDRRPARARQEITYIRPGRRGQAGSWREDETQRYVGRTGQRPVPAPGSHERYRAEYDESRQRPRIFVYARFAKGQLLAEAALLAMTSYSIGSTVHFASRGGFYDLVSGASHIRYATYGPEHESAAKMMYAGAIWWIICFPVAFIILLFVLRMVILNEYRDSDDSRRDEMGLVGVFFVFSLLLMASLFLGQWLWLVGFVNLMGPLYCPPNLTEQALIWISASIVGIVLGAGFG